MIDEYSTDLKILLNCSFCRKSQDKVRKLIAGSDAYICNECISLCNNIINQDFTNKNILYTNNFQSKTPDEIMQYLNEYVVGQEKTKKILSVAVYNHYKRLYNMSLDNNIEIGKSNILLIGPTGSGKTLLAETLAKFLNVPFSIADATSLTEAGYVGEDVENIIQRVLQKYNYNIEEVQKSIIYIDEIDKISRKSDNPSITRDVSGEGVQQALLKLIEGTIASIPPQGGRKHPQQECILIDTSNILFICGGSFFGLDKIIERRVGVNNKIGFTSLMYNQKSKDDIKSLDNTTKIFNYLESEDLIKFGFIPELIGRLPVVSCMDQLDETALIKILSAPKNALLKQYQEMFRLEGVLLEFHDEALFAIVQKAIKCKTGARGLRAIMEDILLDVMYELPSNKKNLKKVIINKAVILEKSNPIFIYNYNK